ncbi:MAG: peptidylprolyl isomerase [Desulfovibrio sp.]
MNRKYFSTLAILCMLLLPAQAFAQDVVVDRVIAVVNGTPLTLFDLNKDLDQFLAKNNLDRFNLSAEAQAQLPSVKKNIVERMIDALLINAEAERRNVIVDDSEIDGVIEDLKQRRGQTDEVFRAQLLKEQGSTFDEFFEKLREDIKKRKLLGGVVSRRAVVTESEVRAEFEKQKGHSIVGRVLSLRSIMLPESGGEISAKDLYEQIDDDDITFEAAADKYSKGPGVGQGGAMGTLEWGDLAPEWQNAMRNLPEGKVSKPFVLNGMAVLVRIDKEEVRETDDFKEAYDDLYNELLEARRDELFAEFMKDLRDNAVIEYKEF